MELDQRRKERLGLSSSIGERRIRSRTISYVQVLQSPNLLVQDGSELVPMSHMLSVQNIIILNLTHLL